MLGKRKYLLVVASLVVLTLVAACAEEQVPTREPVEFSPTEAPFVERAGSEPVVTPTPDPSAGDAVAGEKLFNDNGCATCHSTGDKKVVGPGLAGVYDRAGDRTSLGADAYIEESLREPQAFVVDGYPSVMPSFDRFSSGDMKDLIAFLKTLN